MCSLRWCHCVGPLKNCPTVSPFLDPQGVILQVCGLHKFLASRDFGLENLQSFSQMHEWSSDLKFHESRSHLFNPTSKEIQQSVQSGIEIEFSSEVEATAEHVQ